MTQLIPNTLVQILSRTWEKDKRSLFDNHTTDLIHQQDTISESSILIRTLNIIKILNKSLPENIIGHHINCDIKDIMLRIVKQDEYFWIDKATPSGSTEKLWLVVNQMKDHCYQLVLNDIIKVGCCKLRVIALCINIDETIEDFPFMKNTLMLEPPYIVLKDVLKDGLNEKYYCCSLANNKIVSIGRNNQNDIQFNDVTISRNHATIKFQNNKFFISDNNTKFGTLIHLKKPIKIEDESIVIQRNRTQFKISKINLYNYSN